MGGSSKKQTVGHKIFLGELLHFCLGRIDKFFELRFDDKTAAIGDYSGGDTITINEPELFGGEKKEGGVIGNVDVLDGSITQTQNSYLASATGDVNLPAFRGKAGLVFKKINLGNNPYLRKVSGRFQRIFFQDREGTAQWCPGKAAVINLPLTERLEFGYNVVQLTYSGLSLDASSISNSEGDIRVSSDETRIYFSSRTDPDNGFVHQFVMVNGDLPTALLEYTLAISGISRIEGMSFNGDGTVFYYLPGSASTGVLRSGTCSTPWDLQTVSSFDSVSLPSLTGSVSESLWVHPNGTYVAVLTEGSTSDGLNLYLMSTPNVISSITFVGFSDVDSLIGVGVIEAIDLKSDGTKLYALSNNNTLYELDFTTPWVPSTLSVTSNISLSYIAGDLKAFTWNSSGTRAYCYSTTTDLLYQLSYSNVAYDMNPAHILRELHVSKDYGMSLPEAELDDTVWVAVADALHNDGFGLSYLLDGVGEIEKYIDEVLRTIDAAIRTNRNTGLIELKLIRDDYDVGDLVTLTDSDVKKVLDYKDPTMDNLVNTLTVNFTEPYDNVQDSILVDEPALYQMQQYEVADTRNYVGITKKSLAARVASRDLRTLSYPLKEINMIVKYLSGKDLYEGDVFILNLDEKNIVNTVFRIVEMELGDGIKNEIRMFCVEDIFSTDATGVIAEAETEFVDIVSPPQPCPQTLAIESPYYVLVQDQSQSDIDNRLLTAPEIGFLLIAGVSPGGGVINGNIYVDSGAGYEESGTFDFSPSALLDGAITNDPTEVTFPIKNATAAAPSLNTLLIIDDEIMYLSAYSPTSITVKRGVLDTLPAAHADDSVVMFFSEFDASNEIEYVDSEDIDIKLSPTNSLGEVALSDITADNVIFASRASRPYPPGNFQINTLYYPATIPDTDDIDLTWAHRDRTQQTGGTVYENTFGNIGPETDVEYEIRIYDEADVLIRTYAALTGVSQTYDIATEQSDSGLDRVNFSLRIELEAQRDSYLSWQIYNHTLLRIVTVLDRDLTAPPGGETTGDSYLVAATATGDWVGQENNIATYNGATWDFTTPQTGWLILIDDEAITQEWDGDSWETV